MIGPIMCDVQGASLNEEDKDVLAHPLVGGVILFSRNYESLEQVTELCQQIKAVKQGNILLAVDHEGGRVQRFRENFTTIPAMADIYTQAQNDIEKACLSARNWGQVMAQEVLAVGIDISFAPVLDVQGISEVIGDRAFHTEPEVVAKLASAFVDGMHQAGMKATGKHFPGHGSVKEDSHIALPIDKRAAETIFNFDMSVFASLIAQNKLDAMMPAHIIYENVDQNAVGFSNYWLQQILRHQLHFDGVIFSDDLTMQGAAYIGGYPERAEAAQQAGCDMLLVCNSRAATIDILDHANISLQANSSQRISKLLMNQPAKQSIVA